MAFSRDLHGREVRGCDGTAERTPGVAQFMPTLRSEGPLAAYRLLHRVLRENWASCVISVTTDTGARTEVDPASDLPVHDWCDEEVKATLKLWQKLRRIRNPSGSLKTTIRAARYRYKKLRAEKQRRWQKSFARFWVALKGFSSIWEVLNMFGGKAKNQRCPLSAAVQREQYASTGQPRSHPDFDRGKLAEAQEWLSEFLSSNRGVDHQDGSKFQASHVKAAYRRLHLCAASVDGLNKRWLLPAATLMLHEIAALFSVIYASGTPIVDWCMSIVTSVKKKGRTFGTWTITEAFICFRLSDRCITCVC